MGAWETLGQRLQWILDNRRAPDGETWNGKKLSKAAGLKSDSHIRQIIRGDVGEPGYLSVARIAAVAGVSLVWLMTGQGTPDVPDVPDDGGPVPRFDNLPNWSELLRNAQALEPTLPPWIWPLVGKSTPLLTVPATPGLVAKMARLALEHGARPEDAQDRSDDKVAG